MRLQETEQRDNHGGYRRGPEIAASLASGCSDKLRVGVVLSGEISEY